jgi:GT2 family glycosyltransferase
VTVSVSVVIPTLGPIAQCDRDTAVLLADPAVLEVIVVDDRPAGRSEEPPAVAPPRMRVIVAGGVGPARARQLGVDAARGEVVLLLDDDIRPTPGLASGHARHHDVTGRVVVGYMPVRAPDAMMRESLPRALYRHEYARRIRTYVDDTPEVLRHLWMGNVSLRRADALRVGLASPEFVGYRHEDRDFGLRCAEAGLTGVFDAGLVAEHDYERSLAAFLADAAAQGRELALLHRVHRESLGELHQEALWAGVPAGVKLAARAVLTIGAGPLVAKTLSCGATVAERVGLRTSAMVMLRLARRLLVIGGVRGTR